MTKIQIPDTLYRRLERLARLTHRPVEELVTRALEAGMPPLPETLPDSMRADLLALERLSDDELWHAARSVVSAEHSERHEALLAKNNAGTITESERAQLAQLRQEADALMLRKGYAYVLLKWRGHRLPSLAQLEAAA